jgi:HK97 family phage prohead protease
VAEVTRAIADRSDYRAAPPSTVATPISKTDAGQARYTFQVSSETPDRMGDVIRQAGIQLTEFRRNPVVLWSHDSTQVIGKALSIGLYPDSLRSTMQFNPASGLARNIEAAVRGSFIKATSIGFRPLDWNPLNGGGIKFEEIEMLEYSIVGIPAHPEALIISMTDASGKSSKAKRARELELHKLKAKPLTRREEREDRAAYLARLRASR